MAKIKYIETLNMETASSLNLMIRKKEAILKKEISFMEKTIADYKAERKTSWNTFKSKMANDLNKIKKSANELSHHRSVFIANK
ncbi:MAG: hypothetical protein ABIP51_18935 [Bacteroidia bacterium]